MMLAAVGSHAPACLQPTPTIHAVHFRQDLRGRLLCLARAELQERIQADSAHPLAAWIESRGVQLKKQRAQPELLDDGPALIVTQPTAVGQSLATFPSSSWLTEQVVAKSSIGGLLQGLEGWLQIALFLLHERSSDSAAWAPYVDALPEQPQMPLFWSDAELAELQGTQLLSSVEGYRHAAACILMRAISLLACTQPCMQMCIRHVVSAGMLLVMCLLACRSFFEARHADLDAQLFTQQRDVFPASAFSLEAFLWAVATVRSRVHPPLDGAAVALVPCCRLGERFRGLCT